MSPRQPPQGQPLRGQPPQAQPPRGQMPGRPQQQTPPDEQATPTPSSQENGPPGVVDPSYSKRIALVLASRWWVDGEPEDPTEAHAWRDDRIDLRDEAEDAFHEARSYEQLDPHWKQFLDQVEAYNHQVQRGSSQEQDTTDQGEGEG
jgi:hypothetical protein